MKYAVNYNHKFRHLREVDEIILPYMGDASLEELVEFVTNTFNKSQRIIIDIENKEILDKAGMGICQLIGQGYNMAMRINFKDKIDNEELMEIPFFFAEYPRNLEEVEAQCIAGAADIYITEILGFSMKPLKSIKEKFGVQLRVIPNIAQCAPTARNYQAPMKKFWIRPEDVEIYEDYIDVFELMGGNDDSRLSVVYEIYKQQQWLGSLNDLILDFGGNDLIIPNTGMNPHFAQMRLNCGKACLYSSCNLCNEMGTLAQSFDEVGIEVIKPRKKPERTEEEKQAILNRLGDTYGSGINEETMLSE